MLNNLFEFLIGTLDEFCRKKLKRNIQNINLISFYFIFFLLKSESFDLNAGKSFILNINENTKKT